MAAEINLRILCKSNNVEIKCNLIAFCVYLFTFNFGKQFINSMFRRVVSSNFNLTGEMFFFSLKFCRLYFENII